MKVYWSALLSGARNKIGDVVFSIWKGIPYCRTRVIPANPQSEDQMRVRDSLSRCVPMWRSLENQLKSVLDSYANNYDMSGFNWYISANRVEEESYFSQYCAPPNREIDAVVGLAGVPGAANEIDLTWTGGTQGADYKVYVLSRLRAAENSPNVWTLKEKDTTLVSALAVSIDGLTTGEQYMCVVIVEDTVNHLFSQSLSCRSVAG